MVGKVNTTENAGRRRHWEMKPKRRDPRGTKRTSETSRGGRKAHRRRATRKGTRRILWPALHGHNAYPRPQHKWLRFLICAHSKHFWTGILCPNRIIQFYGSTTEFPADIPFPMMRQLMQRKWSTGWLRPHSGQLQGDDGGA